MALKEQKILIFFTITSFFVCLSCSRKPAYDRLVEYLKEERSLRYRIGQVQGIEDSVAILRKEHGIDLKKSYTDLIKDPEAWVAILQRLKDAK